MSPDIFERLKAKADENFTWHKDARNYLLNIELLSICKEYRDALQENVSQHMRTWGTLERQEPISKIALNQSQVLASTEAKLQNLLGDGA